MNYIDEKIILTVSPIHIGEAGTYTYRLYRGEYQKDWTPGIGELIFIGKAFLQPTDTILKIDVTDIITDQKWIPADMTDDYYYTDSKQVDIISEYYLTLDIDAEIATSGSIGVAKIYRYPNRKVYMNQDLHLQRQSLVDTLLLQGYDPMTNSTALTPRIPFISTDKYPLMFTMQCYRGALLDGYWLKYKKQLSHNNVLLPSMYPGETFYKMSLTDVFRDVVITEGTKRVMYNHFGEDVYVEDIGQAWSDSTQDVWISDRREKPMEIEWRDDQGNLLGYAAFDPGEEEPETYTYQWGGFGHPTKYVDVYLDNHYGDQAYRIRVKTPEDIEFNNIYFKITADAYDEHGYSIRVHDIQFLTVEFREDKGAELAIKGAQSEIKLADVDICPSRYYLLWQDRYGSFQSQPFEKVDTYSESFERSEIRNYRNARRNAQIQIQPRWQINSNWIEEAKYPFYESIFTSPYLVLYDTKEDAKYNVLVTESDYVEKTSKNQRKQLFNLTLNLELDRKQNILY